MFFSFVGNSIFTVFEVRGGHFREERAREKLRTDRYIGEQARDFGHGATRRTSPRFVEAWRTGRTQEAPGKTGG